MTINNGAIDLKTKKGNHPNFSYKNCVFFKHENIFKRVPINNILYIKAKGNSTICYTTEGIFNSNLNLKAFEDLLANYNFKRIHRGYLVSISQITSIDFINRFLFIRDNKIPISRTLKATLMESLPLLV